MMRALGVAMLICFSISFAHAGEDKYSCQFKSKNWKGQLKILRNNEGVLKLQKTGEGEALECPLQIVYSSDLTKGISPSISMRLKKRDCSPGKIGWERLVFQDIFLQIPTSPTPGKKPAILQWLRTDQPDDCHTEKIDLKGLISLSQ